MASNLTYVKTDVVGNLNAKYPSWLIVVDADGGNRRVVTKMGQLFIADERPAWSPDGRQIAFADHRGDQEGIWTVSAEGGRPKLLLDDYHFSMPSWGRPGT